MVTPAALPPDLATALAALFLLFGVPAVLFVLIMLYTGYVRHDAERFLEELEDEEFDAENSQSLATSDGEPPEEAGGPPDESGEPSAGDDSDSRSS